MMTSLWSRLQAQPQYIFLLDGLGAVLTSLLLLFVVQPYSADFGLSKSEIQILATIAACFAVYSLGCFYALGRVWKPFLALIALANLSYASYTIYLCFGSQAQLSALGSVYFLGEAGIILALVGLEVYLLLRKI